jgi:hypothetical protein
VLTEHLAATQSAEAKVLQTVWNKPTHNLGLGEGECALGESCSFYWFRLDLVCARARVVHLCVCVLSDSLLGNPTAVLSGCSFPDLVICDRRN